MKSVVDPRPDLRAFIALNFYLMARHADNGSVFAEIGDDKGLDYCARKAVAYAREVQR